MKKRDQLKEEKFQAQLKRIPQQQREMNDMEVCPWCEVGTLQSVTDTVYWELPERIKSGRN